MRVLFINGVNTAYGGSGAAAVRCWFRSFARFNIDVAEINVHPPIANITNRSVINLIWALYFLPGTIARLIGTPFMEPFYKLSPFVSAKILKSLYLSKWDLVVFSHYAVILYAVFIPRLKRVFIIQDLLYRRARSLGFSRYFCRKIFRFELKMYSLSNFLCALSWQEKRILERFLKCNVSLVSCFETRGPLQSDSAPADQNFIAVVSDWRRRENTHGFRKYLLENQYKFDFDEKPKYRLTEYRLYGYGSDEFIRLIQNEIKRSSFEITSAGLFNSYSEIPTKFFLVPIYHGAGIKLKTIEALMNGKIVIGTKSAFRGLPIKCVAGIAAVTDNPKDIDQALSKIENVDRFNFSRLYSHYFKEIGSVLLERSR